MQNVYKIGELFCGAGGLALGVCAATIEDENGVFHKCQHIWANDSNIHACKTFEENIANNEECKIICEDVENINLKKFPTIDGLLFGFPCNDFSLVGEQEGMNGDHGPLYSYGIEALDYHNPIFFIAENVDGFSSINNGKTFRMILSEMSKAGYGYNLTSHLYKFEDYGIPQKRHRIVIVGFRKDLELEYKVPAPTHENNHISCSEALKGVEEIEHNNIKTNHAKKTIKRLKYIPPGANAWHPNIPEDLRLNVNGCKMSHIYRRLEGDKPAYTLTGNGGGGTHVYHWEEPRALTNRERARLQTFPDDYIFYGGKEAVRTQIGHAVPPLGAKIITEALLKCLVGIDYESIPASKNYSEL
ncbi:MAG: DNA cytosine methyltransferase [Candidatus Woesearchaeota archaeon]